MKWRATLGDAGVVLTRVIRDVAADRIDLTAPKVVTVYFEHRTMGGVWSVVAVADGDQVTNKGLARVTLTAADLAATARSAGEHDVAWVVTGASFAWTYPPAHPVTGERDTLVLDEAATS